MGGPSWRGGGRRGRDRGGDGRQQFSLPFCIFPGGSRGGLEAPAPRNCQIQEIAAGDSVPSRAGMVQEGAEPLSGGGPAGGAEPPAQKRARFFGPKITAPLGASPPEAQKSTSFRLRILACMGRSPFLAGGFLSERKNRIQERTLPGASTSLAILCKTVQPLCIPVRIRVQCTRWQTPPAPTPPARRPVLPCCPLSANRCRLPCFSVERSSSARTGRWAGGCGR